MQILRKSNLLTAVIALIAGWFVTFCITLVTLMVMTDMFKNIANESEWNNPDTAIFGVFAICLILSILFYFSSMITLTYFLTVSSQVRGKLWFAAKYLWIALILPFYALYRLTQYLKTANAQRIPAITAIVFLSFVFVPMWLAPVFGGGYAAANAIGFVPVSQEIAGTGSMYPTFPKGTGETDKENAVQVVTTASFNRYPGGIKISDKQYFLHTFERGDIIVFESNTTRKITKEQYGEPTGMIKRIVAIPGDTLELRGGIVYLNDKPLQEPYTAGPRSTFAQTFLSECKEITVPANKLFVMGDNRKLSGDSREFGYVDFIDVTGVIPLNAQKNTWDKYWRDTTKDFDESSLDKIDKKEYVAMINEKRKEAGAPLLQYSASLEQSAQKRGESMLQFNDFSFEATKSGYTIERAMGDIGYYDKLVGETYSHGYYKAYEMFEYQFIFPDSQVFLLDKAFDEIGIAEVESEINGCPTQVIVQHFSGNISPSYKQ